MKKRSKTIAWVCGELRKFSQFASELAILITKYPYENEFSTDILLLVLRKSNLWFDFLKFTFAVRSRLGGNMATRRVANHRFCERVSKIVMCCFALQNNTICAKLSRFFANFTATFTPTFKSFSGRGAVFQKSPTFFTLYLLLDKSQFINHSAYI